MGYATVAAGVEMYFEDHLASPCPPTARAGFEAIVLIHGWCCDSADWDGLVPGLSRLGRVVRLDLRGHGRSSGPAEGYTLGLMSGDVVALLRHLGLGRVVLVGHSAGAEVAAAISVSHPGSVHALVSVDPAYGFAETDRGKIGDVARRLAVEDAPHVAASYFATLDTMSPSASRLADSHRRMALRSRPNVAAEMFRQFAFGPGAFHFRSEAEAFLGRRRCAMLAVYRDAARARVGTSFMADPRDEVLIYDGSGHWPHQEQPSRFIGDVECWLDSIAPSPRRPAP